MFADSTFFGGEDSDLEDYQDSIDVRWIQGRCRPRQVRPRDDPFYRYDDVDFITRFRLSKDATIRLLSRIEHAIAFDGLRNCPLSPINQLLVALRFYATGTFQVVLGDLWGVHKSTVCRVVKRVTHAIAALARDFISFPTTEAERRTVSEGFYSMQGFPGVVGAIDCTHVPIQSPGGDHAELYRNRAGYFSINVQTVSDHQLCIRNIVVRWPGSVHDSTIFGNSALKALFESGQMNESILLGDGGYACSRYLFTPVAAPKTPAERAYNRAHIPTRSTVERQYGVWKRRFPALEFGLRIKLETALSSIVAMAVVHNLALQLGEAEPPVDLRLASRRRVFSDVVVEHVPEHHGRTSARSALIDQVFARRARVARRRE
ncbi:putative nuclease HARBI1 [Ixodes scapularis]|uniref:putative nuclease HARBI1 n=1 Tax=Ixodes scapularis TaxID=6945 RepID=UPI001A9D692D|nr:putative nuclease HARBI1 [Ixodes scapularis]